MKEILIELKLLWEAFWKALEAGDDVSQIAGQIQLNERKALLEAGVASDSLP